ncbi:MAG: TauD/TfdA family dioxygenase, partial [Alphaproteobacteria bacterium]|nr:TauD/TfdA family dioxygenase [Alphaproteobacteria bacterium]
MPASLSGGQSAMGKQTIEVRQVGGALGAEIAGVDLAQPLDDAAIAAIRQALLDHLVVFFRDQDITPAQHLAFARCFGETAEYPMLNGLEEYPEIVEVVKLEHEKANFGGAWHSDTAYLDTPPMGSILVAREVPEAGGDTEFAN